MKFCDKCGNKLYVQVIGNTVKYHCYVCGLDSNEKVTIINEKKYKSEDKTDTLIKKMMYDITYPIINTKCTTEGCLSNSIAYYRMEDMQNIYFCRECKKWTKGGGSVKKT